MVFCHSFLTSEHLTEWDAGWYGQGGGGKPPARAPLEQP